MLYIIYRYLNYTHTLLSIAAREEGGSLLYVYVPGATLLYRQVALVVLIHYIYHVLFHIVAWCWLTIDFLVESLEIVQRLLIFIIFVL
ncbi:hypothetical protein FGO68_gene13160 [Halteria grandinella]|uniref:Uncharacterized protein n=1 Tax=Halteria grandinella TaxID=5974 RepID=A0A8J8NG96_HALGN|nr:hypothetical protein FGO68_gene13160 [Halteria grandinella]